MQYDYNIVIIGSGPAGLEAAKLAGKNNLKCALIERNKLGGICFNWGCIPMKFYIQKLKEAKKAGVYITLEALYNEKEDFLSSGCYGGNCKCNCRYFSPPTIKG